MLVDFIKKHHIVIFILFIMFIILVGWWIYLGIDRMGKLPFQLTVTPAESALELNGVKVKNGTLYLKPGDYQVTASYNGFYTKNESVPLRDKAINLTISLPPQSDEAKKWASENKKLYGEEYNEFAEIDPMLTKLPYNNLLYSLKNTNPNKQLPIVVDVISVKGYRNAPIEYIKRIKIDPSLYEYKFNYENPFK